MSSDDDIRRFEETYRITFPVGRENGIAGLLGVRGIPVTVFIGKDGRIAKRYYGSITYSDLEKNVNAIIK